MKHTYVSHKRNKVTHQAERQADDNSQGPFSLIRTPHKNLLLDVIVTCMINVDATKNPKARVIIKKDFVHVDSTVSHPLCTKGFSTKCNDF